MTGATIIVAATTGTTDNATATIATRIAEA